MVIMSTHFVNTYFEVLAGKYVPMLVMFGYCVLYLSISKEDTKDDDRQQDFPY